MPFPGVTRAGTQPLAEIKGNPKVRQILKSGDLCLYLPVKTREMPSQPTLWMPEENETPIPLVSADMGPLAEAAKGEPAALSVRRTVSTPAPRTQRAVAWLDSFLRRIDRLASTEWGRRLASGLTATGCVAAFVVGWRQGSAASSASLLALAKATRPGSSHRAEKGD